MKKNVVIIGAGPSGLTAAHKLVDTGNFNVIILEKTEQIGGISQTVKFKGNRIDIGGHRFFSKSDTVMNYWKKLMPIQGHPACDDKILNKKIEYSDEQGAPDPEKTDSCLLIRNRVSRIYFLRKFFDYPISLSASTVLNLGIFRTFNLGFGYLKSILFPRREENTLEDFLINRFGSPLYNLFFKSYTEKVWGRPCDQISADWGAQRIKGLSIGKAVLHAFKRVFKMDKSLSQKDTETSLIERFLYPKLGPGQLWEADADYVVSKGADLRKNSEVFKLVVENGEINKLHVRNIATGEEEIIEADHVISSMPIRDLVASVAEGVPDNVREVAVGLEYRDFITVGVLLNKILLSNNTKVPTVNGIIPDNWIYIQEREVRLGRLQVFNNWSPYLVKDPNTVWLGLEYFCNEGDDLWSMDDDKLKVFAIEELASIDVVAPADVLDCCVLRVEKAYPAYFGSYERFDEVRGFLDKISNLYPVGRNGMHRYNNMDHSMLSAMKAASLICEGSSDKIGLWEINAEKEYHEQK